MQIILSAALIEVAVRQKQVLCYLNTGLTYVSPILRIQNNIDREPMLLNTAGKSSFLFAQGLQKKTAHCNYYTVYTIYYIVKIKNLVINSVIWNASGTAPLQKLNEKSYSKSMLEVTLKFHFIVQLNSNNHSPSKSHNIYTEQ